MEEFTGLFVFLAIVWTLLCIILFFKIWGMTNNVKKILDILSRNQNKVTTTGLSLDYDIRHIEESGIAKNDNILATGKKLITKYGILEYFGIFQGKHSLYPVDYETRERISNHPTAVSDNSGEIYLALTDDEFSSLVDNSAILKK